MRRRRGLTSRASRSAYWPTLTLAANTGWNGSRANDYNFQNQRQLSLSLRWNLFNGFDRELNIVQQRGGPGSGRGQRLRCPAPGRG